MGFFGKAADRVRDWSRKDKASASIQFAKGATSSGAPAQGYDLLQAYGYDVVADYLKLEHDLLSRFVDYEEMDDYPELAAAIDIYADDSTQTDMQLNRSMWLSAPDKDIESLGNDLFHKTLRIDEEIWEISRTVVKYGNDYEELLVNDEGVRGINFMPPPTVRRIEGPRGELFGFIQDFKGRTGYSPAEMQQILAARATAQSGGTMRDNKITALEDWEVVHFRLRGKHRRSIYGYSALEPARWIWKRLMLLEDAALIYRLQRAPERYAFYVDVGDLPPREAMAYVNKVRQQFKKKKFVNPSTGKLDLKWEPLPVSHDTPIPLLDGRTITISEMAKEHADGKKHWVYSIDRETGNSVPGEVSWVGQTRESAPAVKVTFDDGREAVMAPDHPVMLRDRSYSNAEDLTPGDSVMPFYRRVSDKSAGDGMEGYELVYNPETQFYEYTHRMVAKSLGLKKKGELIHHSSLDKRNNDPSQLESMCWRAHNALHTELGQSGGAAVAKLRKEDEDLDARLRAASARNIIAYNKSDAKRASTSVKNRDRDSAQFIRAYNATPKHTADNEIRREGKLAFWANEEAAAQAVRNMRVKFPDAFVADVRSLIRSNPEISGEGVVRAVNSSVLVDALNKANTREVSSVHRHLLLKMYRDQGCQTFSEFKESALTPPNHKVVSVEVVENCDHYCMTVERWHNFALSLRSPEGEVSFKSGVYVKNSQDEDFFIPTRKGADSTRIEVVGSPSWQHMDDIEYFQRKLFSAMKVPKAYLGQEEGVARAVLSSEDTRFARTILRVQRELRNGMSKVFRTHMAAIGIDPTRVEYEIHMTTPSSIFELAQLEVRNARADLATRMREHVSLHWVLANVFGMGDAEIETVVAQREEDTIRDMAAEGKGQAEAQKALPPEPGFEGGSQPVSAPATPKASSASPGGEMATGEEAQQSMHKLYSALKRNRRSPRSFGNTGARGITEQELFRGSREAERRAEDKLDLVLRQNKVSAGRLKEAQGLLRELVRSR